MTIYEKLGLIQSQLKSPKKQYNQFGKYYYRNCEDIQEAVKPILLENKVALVLDDEVVTVGDRVYIKSTARLIDWVSGESIENHAYAREDLEKKGMDGSQLTGSCSSYARKYALNGLFCIDDSKDFDSPERKKGLIEEIQKELTRTGKTMKRPLETMTENTLAETLHALKQYPDKKTEST